MVANFNNMKISGFVCLTNPEERQDPWREHVASALSWADELVIVNGGKPLSYPDNRVRFIEYAWPYDFSWEELPKHLNAGLEACTGDWAIRLDVDYIFEDGIADELRDRLAQINDMRVATFQKMSAILSTKFYQKGGISLGFNKRFADTVVGRANEEHTDLCMPIVKEGEEDGVPFGRLPTEHETGRTGIRLYNYDYTFKTREFSKAEFWRFSKAYYKYFGEYNWGDTEEKAIAIFEEMMRGRLAGRHIYTFSPDEQPSFIREKIKDIKPEEFGYDGWGKL